MCCRYVGTVRLRVEGVVGSLSDASATLRELCFTRALITSAGSKVPGPADGSIPPGPLNGPELQGTGRVDDSSSELLSTPPSCDASKNPKSGPRGRAGSLGSSTIMTHYTQCSGARTPMTEMAKSA